MNIFRKPLNFLIQVKEELKKVSWSTRQEVFGSTVVVIIITAMLTVFIGIADLFLSKMLTVIFR
ncbi:MAG: preprotein translocase subunit SecE [Candidatus Omnitrophota bacterium]